MYKKLNRNVRLQAFHLTPNTTKNGTKTEQKRPHFTPK